MQAKQAKRRLHVKIRGQALGPGAVLRVHLVYNSEPETLKKVFLPANGLPKKGEFKRFNRNYLPLDNWNPPLDIKNYDSP